MLSICTDKKAYEEDAVTGLFRYEAHVISAQDYYPFGWEIPGRKYNSGSSYRFGFNGKENDREYGSQLVQDYGFRVYNPSIGRFLSEDPLTEKYPELTPYQFASNTPIWAIDLDGLEAVVYAQSVDFGGHTFIEINGVVYDYGRYEGGFLSAGPGILFRLEGQEAQDYIANVLDREEPQYRAFLITDVDANAAQEYFEAQYNATDQTFYDRGDQTTGRHIDTYDVFFNTCATKCSESLLAGGTATIDDWYQTPSNLEQDLIEISERDPELVIDITEEEIERTSNWATEDYVYPHDAESSYRIPSSGE